MVASHHHKPVVLIMVNGIASRTVRSRARNNYKGHAPIRRKTEQEPKVTRSGIENEQRARMVLVKPVIRQWENNDTDHGSALTTG